MSALLGSPISRISVAGDERNPPVTPDACPELSLETDSTDLTGDCEPKHVLLLEGDASFREILKAFLCEKGYVVHEAECGFDGIQKVLTTDFSVVLYDTQLPNLAGDLSYFYRSVERKRPELCGRIIFVTGQCGDSTANDFIGSIKGRVLIPPFQLDELSELMGVIEKQAPRQDSKVNRASTPRGAAAVAPPPAQASTVAAKPDEKRVLLLEDDPAFRGVIREFLSEAGYTVREAQDGVQGIREIMEGEFAIILCDMMMPGLDGDHFYRGVERLRPHMAERFIFMTGHRGDAKINAFFQETTGRALIKPFSLDELIETIGGLGKPRPTALNEASGGRKISPAPPASSHPSSRPVDQPAQVAAPTTPTTPASFTKPTAGYEPCVASRSPVAATQRPRRILAPLVLVASVALAGVALSHWRSVLESRCAALSGDLAAAERERTVASKELAEAELLEPGFQAAVASPDRLKSERAAPKWTQVLTGVGQALGGELEIQGLRARRMIGPSGACEVHIDGHSSGLNRRATADAFRHKIEQELQRDPRNAPVKTGFLRLEELFADPAARTHRQTLDFEVVATVRAEDAPVFKRVLAY